MLAKVWARQKIEDLMQQSFYAGSPEVEEVVTRTGARLQTDEPVHELRGGRFREAGRGTRAGQAAAPNAGAGAAAGRHSLGGLLR